MDLMSRRARQPAVVKNYTSAPLVSAAARIVSTSTMSSYARVRAVLKDYTYSGPQGTVAYYLTGPGVLPVMGTNQSPSYRSGAPKVFQYIGDAATDTCLPKGSFKADRYIAKVRPRSALPSLESPA